ncbi:MAG TPA: hypothetical protein VMT76_01430 [Puia sp.]|nr:hypothetical protein [Puia sp.]
MQKTNGFTLIKGFFSADEAMTILHSLFDYKINYHNMEIFGITERMKYADIGRHTKRVEELKSEKEKLELFLKDAQEKNFRLSIEGQIKIEMVAHE